MEDFQSFNLSDEETDVLDNSVALSSEAEVQCPHCGTFDEISLDPSVGDQTYIDDCSTCCRSMQVNIEMTEDGPVIVTSVTG